MNTETEDRRSTQVSEQRTVNSEQCATDCVCPKCWPQLDRSDEFDQTRQHYHFERSVCPVNNFNCPDWPPRTIENQFGETVPPSAMGTPRHVSPAIREFQIEQLTGQLKEMTLKFQSEVKYSSDLLNDLALRDKRICELTELNRRMAVYIDENGPKMPVVEQADGYRDAA